MINYLKRNNNQKKIILYGLGNAGKKIIEIVSKYEIPIFKIIDNNEKLWWTTYKGIEIVPADYLHQIDRENVIVFIGCTDIRKIKNELKSIGIREMYRDKDLFREKVESMEPIRFQCSENPVVSIVITAKNDFEYTYNCLKSIAQHKTEIPYEILLGDDCSIDETSVAENYFEGVKVIHYIEPMHYLGNCNATIAQAKGEFIYLLGNDILITQNRFLETFLNKFEDSIGAIGGKTIVPCNDTISEVTAFVYDKQGSYHRIKEDKEQDADFILVTNMMIRKSIWEKVGGYSKEYLPAYYEDNDLCLKIKDAGYRLKYVGEGTQVIHYEGVTVSQHSTNAEKNRKFFLQKWKKVFPEFLEIKNS